MKFTGNTALKVITLLETEKNKLLNDEKTSMIYSYFEGETPSIPEYSFVETYEKVKRIDSDVAKIKHAVKQFNLNSIGTLSGLTGDEILVNLPQYTAVKNRLSRMRQIPEKTRQRSMSGGNGSEYQVRNFAVEDVEKKYQEVSLYLMNLQEDMNRINLVGEFEVDVDLSYIGM